MTDSEPATLSFADLSRELARFTYLPGWRLRLGLDPFEGPVLWVLAEVPDAYHPEQTAPLRIRSLVPPMADADAFAEWLLWRVLQIASHEAREWLRRDGKPLHDPHQVAEIDGHD